MPSSPFDEPIDPALLDAASSLAPPDVPPPVIAPTPAPAPAPAPTAAARRPASRFRLRLGPEPEAHEDLVTPEKVKSWATSLGLHVLLLLLLAVAVSTREVTRPRQLEVGLPAGDPAGSDLGQQLTGGLGMDEPLAMPYAPEIQEEDPSPTLALADAPDAFPRVDPRPAADDATKGSASGGGVTLEGTGQAGRGDGFGVARFGLGGSELINNVEVKVGNPQFTLIWNTTADLDLHVLEPGGSHIYWEKRAGARGGELDVDDVDGYGPENIFWGGGLNKGNGPPGVYRWHVHYYGGDRGNLPTRWRVRLKHNGAYKVFEGRLLAIGQRSKTYEFSIDGKGDGRSPADDAAAAAPAAEAPDPAVAATPDRRRRGDAEAFERPASALDGLSPEARRAMTDRAEAVARATAPPAGAPPRPSAAAGVEREDGWVVVRPPGLALRALMPDTPFDDRIALENRPGAPEVRVWSLDRGDGELVLAARDLPPADAGAAAADPAALLDREARALATEAGGANVQVGAATGAAPGPVERTVRFDVPERVVAGGGVARLRLVIADGRLVRASATGTRDFADGPEAARFLASLTFGPAAAPPASAPATTPAGPDAPAPAAPPRG